MSRTDNRDWWSIKNGKVKRGKGKNNFGNKDDAEDYAKLLNKKKKNKKKGKV